MRHRNKGYKLGRTSAHRKATMAALSNALIEHKRITTTVTKAKALRMYVEPLINRAKVDSTHNRREVFRHLQSKAAVTELFGDVAAQVGDRPGGFTRVIRLGQRSGDGAEMAVIELVDYNDVKPEGSSSAGRKRTRRGSGKGRRRRSRGAKAAAAATQAKAAAAEEAAVEAAEAEASEADEATAEADVDEAPVEEAKAATPVTQVDEESEPTPQGRADAAVEEEPEAEADEEPKAEVEAEVDEEPQAEAEDEPEADEDDEKKEG